MHVGALFRFRGESLELRLALTASVFVPQQVAIEAQVGPVEVGDLDADGDLDIVVNDSVSSSSWRENTDAASGSYERRALGRFGAREWLLADLNGEGADELVVVRSTSRSGLEIVILSNADAEGTFVAGEPVARLPFSLLTELTPVDFDSDGDLDLMVGGSDAITNASILWLRNDGDLDFALIPIRESINGITPSMDILDLDGDGDLDILSSYDQFLNIGFPGPSPFTGPDSLFDWYELADDGAFVRHHVSIDPIPGLNAGTQMRDVDNDGDMDLVRASVFRTSEQEGFTLTLGWFENTDGDFGNERVIDQIASPSGLQTDAELLVRDFDFDGTPEIILGVEGIGIRTYSNDGGSDPRFSLTRTAFDNASVGSLKAVDFDGDDDLDIVTTVDGSVVWLENRLAGDIDGDNQVTFADFLSLSHEFGNEVEPWTRGDLDGDGVVDFPDFLLLSANFGGRRTVKAPVG